MSNQIEIKFNSKEIELLIMLAGAFLLDKSNCKTFEFKLEEKIALNNKLRFLKIQSEDKDLLK